MRSSDLPEFRDVPAATSLALFLDFDGTLVDIAPRPDAVELESRTRAALVELFELSGGAVAIVTGREIEVIDGFLAPPILPVAGVHGVMRRDATGMIRNPAAVTQVLDEIEAGMQALSSDEPGLFVERKTCAVALHFRARPELQDRCEAAAGKLAARAQGFTVQRGKMVVEVRPGGHDKGMAVRAFLNEAPFVGRTALFAGDDVTDEAAFTEVNARGGVSIKVGPGGTDAVYRCCDAAAFRDWLSGLAQHWRDGVKGAAGAEPGALAKGDSEATGEGKMRR